MKLKEVLYNEMVVEKIGFWGERRGQGKQEYK
jgi:hypothetical protein